MTDNYPMGTNGSDAHFNEPNPPECPNRDCMATLEPDWEWCPFCGWHIDWEMLNEVEPDDYEGVSRPLVMGR